MTEEYRISKVVSLPTSSEEIKTGKLAYISCTLNGAMRLNGLTLRRTLVGDYCISYPFRRDGKKKKRYYYYPLNEVARKDIEYQILVILGLGDHRKSA